MTKSEKIQNGFSCIACVRILKFSSNENRISSTFKLLIVHQKYYYSAAVDAEIAPLPKTNTKIKSRFFFSHFNKNVC